ncbi:hypothetical protein XENOCAPTIV_029617 [Xenoophorus captivus]|uniref:Uncharacterized protein n=1 Tax=Xenoophorus captivus TaxID=1517983 RepID=A0ABV0Q4Y6_9TELE
MKKKAERINDRNYNQTQNYNIRKKHFTTKPKQSQNWQILTGFLLGNHFAPQTFHLHPRPPPSAHSITLPVMQSLGVWVHHWGTGRVLHLHSLMAYFALLDINLRFCQDFVLVPTIGHNLFTVKI